MAHETDSQMLLHRPLLGRPIFVASLGNPPPRYTNTLHSAGHTLLESIRYSFRYPEWERNRSFANGFTSRGRDYTLWQSPSLMNVSGKAVATAWQAFLKEQSSEDRPKAKLIILHDELESPLGKVRFKIGGSAKGHNGLKSCISALGGLEFLRVGIGIGRPESRESGDVAAYVLRQMKPAELQKVSDGAGEVMQKMVYMAEE
ncbi:MAG: hypothetical protein Q9195_007568 [Heterodermia aff. obscurata]